MAVAQPQILLVLNDAAGTTVVNDGTGADVAVGQGVENTNWEWHSGEGSFDGWWESLGPVGQGDDAMPWIDLTGVTLPTDAEETPLWAAIRFQVTDFDPTSGGQGFLLGSDSNQVGRGGIAFMLSGPTSTGDFDLQVILQDQTQFGASQEIIFPDLSFGVDYAVSCYADTTVVTAQTFRAKLDGGTVQAAANANRSGGATWLPDAGFVGRYGGFTDYFGFIGRLYYLAHGRGVLITDTDLADLNSNPKATITGWPSAGPTGTGTLAAGSLTATLSGTGTATLSATPGVQSPTLKEPNASDTTVANSSTVTVRIWHGATITGTPDETLTNQSITSGVLEFEVATTVGAAISYQARWTVGAEDRFFEVLNATAIDLDA